MIDGSSDLRSRRQSVRRAKIATGKMSAGNTSVVRGKKRTRCHVIWYSPSHSAIATTGKLWAKIIALRQITRSTSDIASRVELSSKLRSVSNRSAPSFNEVEIRVQIAKPIPSRGVRVRALLSPTSPMAIDEPVTIAASDAADHHGPSFVRAYWALRSRHPKWVQIRKLESETNKTDERRTMSLLSVD